MKRLNLSFIILLFVSAVFAQDQVISQSEELNVAQIEEKAKEDAKTDFTGHQKTKWGAGSLLTSWGGLIGSIPGVIIGIAAPFSAAKYFQVNFPEHRELELSSKSAEYQNTYRPVYIKEIIKQRRKYAMLGPSSCGLVILFIVLNPDMLSNIGTCFAEGTEITMADGSSKRVEDIEIGDMIMGYNFETQKIEPDEVLELYSTANDNMMEMKFSDGTVIRSTFDHPYYVKDKGWCSLKPDVTKELITNITEVGQLEDGDMCHLLKDGLLIEVELVGSHRIHVFQRTYTIKKLKKNNAFFAECVLVGVETVKETKSKTLLGYLK